MKMDWRNLAVVTSLVLAWEIVAHVVLGVPEYVTFLGIIAIGVVTGLTFPILRRGAR